MQKISIHVLKFPHYLSFSYLLNFIKSLQFIKALALTLSSCTAIFVFNLMGHLEWGISAAVGILLCSASDVPGTLRKKLTAVLLSTALAVSVTVLVSFAAASQYILVPVLLCCMFFISYLAIYGFRASLISFSGLLAAVLAMANLSETPVLVHAAFIGVGGLWYLFISISIHFLNPKRQEDHMLAEGFALTAKYIRTRAHLLGNPAKRANLQEEQLFLQNDINEKHEQLREVLINTRRTSGSSNFQRQKLNIFIELVDILELAMANPVDYERLDLVFQNQKNLKQAFEQHILNMAEYLEYLSETVKHERHITKKPHIKSSLHQLKKGILAIETGAEAPSKEMLSILQNMYDYQEKQFHKINFISRILSNKKVGLRRIRDKEAEKFVTPQEINFDIFFQNLNFKSAIFKHSLRLTVVVLFGILIGNFFEVQKTYWILLTLVVILRPNYGLTKERSKNRTIGTIFGAIAAAIIVYFFQNPLLYGILAVISFLLAFSLIQKNYKWAAGFITLNVVFIYALLAPNAFDVIQFRVLDTALGAGLAYLGILLLWPSWEQESIEKIIAEGIRANTDYLKEIKIFYSEKTKVFTSYRLSRKAAFLAMGNLSAAFQRMTQEPKRKQKDSGRFYELVVLNQTFLSSLASLGTFIQNHRTTAASKHFEVLVSRIENNLNAAVAQLELKEVSDFEDHERLKAAQEYLNQKYRDLVEVEEGKDRSFRKNAGQEEIQEAQLIVSQLRWLLEVSEKLQKKTKK